MKYETEQKRKGKGYPFTYFMLIFFTILCLSSKSALCDINKNLLKNEIVTTLIKLGKTKAPIYFDAIWPSNDIIKSKRVNVSTVHPRIIEASTNWIRTMIKDEWIPLDLDKKLIAIKDWKKSERRDEKGYIISEYIADYLIAEFSIQGYNIQIQENGSSVDILILPTKSNKPSLHIENYITDCIKKFLKFPNQKFGRIEYNLKNVQIGKDKNIYYGKVQCEWDPKKMSDLQYLQNQIWWNYISVCTDGHFIFLGIPERDGKPKRPQAKPGIPSRF